MLRRWRGVIAIVVALVAATAWFVVADPTGNTAIVKREPLRAATDLATMAAPTGVMSWSRAKAAGKTADFEWGDRCDQDRGTVAMAVAHPNECFAQFTGDNGGTTAIGVTTGSIKVVIYQAAPGGGLSGIISSVAAGANDPAAAMASYRGYSEILSHYFETYGRTVEIVAFKGTGEASDPVAAVADAETIAQDLAPFMVIGGPLLTNAFADTLAARKIMCWNCTPGQSSDWFVRHAPYVWDLQKNPVQGGLMVNEYIGKRLMNRPAIYAGDPAMKVRDRVFGSLHITLGQDSEEVGRALDADRKRWGFSYAADAAFSDPTQLASIGRELITKLKSAGVTTVVYIGDPLAPATFTKIATEQQYFPEWVITGTALIDITLLPRTYDQSQWSHAFGPANLFVRSAGGRVPAADLWTWWFDADPPVPGAAGALTLSPLQLLYTALQLMGPDVTVAHFRDALFSAPTQPGSPTLGQVSFGDRGVWPVDDYTGVDDQGEVWWDPSVIGVDELGRPGVGMYRWTNGGRRVLPGGWSTGQPALFDPATAITEYDEPNQVPHDYPPLRGQPI